MEHPQTMSNLWVIVRTIAWIMALEGVAEFIGDRHSHALFRRLVTALLERDPATPRLPDNWEELYNS
jgi:hypothetical protein